MKKGFWLALLGVTVAAVATGIGIAATSGGTADPVSATFSATATGETRSQTCAARGGATIRTTWAVYRGAWSGDRRLAGTLTIRSRRVVDASSGDGALNGRLVVTDADGKLKARLHLHAVVDGGSYSGWIAGRVRQAGNDHGGALRATITGSVGETLTGRLGASDGVATVIARAGCKDGERERAGERPNQRAERRTATGAITALSATSITVGDLTCSLGARMAARLAARGVAVGTRVRIACVARDGGWRLARIGRA